MTVTCPLRFLFLRSALFYSGCIGSTRILLRFAELALDFCSGTPRGARTGINRMPYHAVKFGVERLKKLGSSLSGNWTPSHLRLVQVDPNTNQDCEVGTISREQAIQMNLGISADNVVRVSPMLLGILVENFADGVIVT